MTYDKQKNGWNRDWETDNLPDDMTGVDERLGRWLSAALEDPTVCEEMKADIRAWFDKQDKRT